MNELVVKEQVGHDAEKMLELLQEFDKEYTRAIINNIMSCPTEDVDKWRNLAKAEESFKSYLSSLIEDGNIARVNIDDINENLSKTVDDANYWWGV